VITLYKTHFLKSQILKDKIKNKLIKIIIKIIRIKSDTKENLIAYFDHLRATEGN
jgi:hypothetical protein